MATSVLILGHPGTGKSTAIRTLDPEETFIIAVVNKSLPFPGWRKKYTKVTNDNPEGNYYVTDQSSNLVKILSRIHDKRPNVKQIVIDDFDCMMSNELFRRSSERGYNKFTEIGRHAFDVLSAIEDMRDDMIVFVLSHIEEDTEGRKKSKTVGKMVDQYMELESRFTIVLYAEVEDRDYHFRTQNVGMDSAKSPMSMFDELFIENDLELVANKIRSYEQGNQQ